MQDETFPQGPINYHTCRELSGKPYCKWEGSAQALFLLFFFLHMENTHTTDMAGGNDFCNT